jgi:hypothetical protein
MFPQLTWPIVLTLVCLWGTSRACNIKHFTFVINKFWVNSFEIGTL